MQTTAKRLDISYMVELSVLIAIIFIMAFTQLGYIHAFGIEITLIVIPVAVGAITLGPTAGLILGLVFGITSVIQCFGFSAFGAMLMSINPLANIVLRVPTRMLMGWLVGMIYKTLRDSRASAIAVPAACLASPVLNTLFFMSVLCLFFYNTEYIQGIVSSLGATNVIAFIIAFVGINAVFEACACLIVGTAISKALLAIKKN